jgi:hypothetical protein
MLMNEFTQTIRMWLIGTQVMTLEADLMDRHIVPRVCFQFLYQAASVRVEPRFVLCIRCVFSAFLECSSNDAPPTTME